MMRHILTVATFVACVTLSACERQAESSRRFADPSAAPAESQAEYEKRVREELANFDKLITDLNRRAQDAKVETKEALSQAMEDLEEKRQVLQKRLDELKAAGVAISQNIRSEIDEALDELRQAYERATSELK